MEELKKGGSYSVCLSSVACRESFPQNSPTDFVNTLPVPIRQEEADERLFLRLKMAGVCAFLPTKPPVVIRVHISELEPQREGLGYTQVAGTLSFPPSERFADSFGVHFFRDPPTLPLRVVELSKLHIRLTDEFNQKITLAGGPPTLVWVEITKMQGRETFTVSCVSQQPDSFPANTLTNFYTPLPQEVALKDYEVALQYVVYPLALQENLLAWIRVNGKLYTYNLSKFKTFRELGDQVHKDMQHATGRRLEFRRKQLFFGRNTDRWRFYNDHFLKKMPYKKPGHTGFASKRIKAPVTLSFSYTFAAASGLKGYEAGEKTLAPYEELWVGAPPGGEGAPLNVEAPIVLVECDIIKPNVLAGRNGQLLHCVPGLPNISKEEQVRLYEPPNQVFHPVSDKPFTRIGIRFTNEKGELRHFYSPNKEKDTTVISLLFRKIKKE